MGLFSSIKKIAGGAVNAALGDMGLSAVASLLPGKGSGGGVDEAGNPTAGPAPFDYRAAQIAAEQSASVQRAGAASATLSDNEADNLGTPTAGPRRRSASRALLG